MDIRELIVLGGVILVVLIVGHGLWSAWSKHRSRLKMRIEPELVPPDDDEDWLNAELPAGGARVMQPEEAETGEAEAAEQPEVEGPSTVQQPAAPPLEETNVLAGPDAADEPEHQWPQPPTAVPDADDARAAPEQEPDDAAPEGDEDAAPEEGALLIVRVLAPEGQRFASDALLAALRGAGLKYGEMRIFHRLKPPSQKAVFSVANAVEPGYFDLGGDCSSPGVTAFMELTGDEQDFEALDDLIDATQSIADALGGTLQDERRQPFTSATLERYRGRVASFVQQQNSG